MVIYHGTMCETSTPKNKSKESKEIRCAFFELLDFAVVDLNFELPLVHFVWSYNKNPDFSHWGLGNVKMFDILLLVGGFNPFEKYARQIGSFPQVKGENSKKIYKEITT